ncbi:cbb3-type cytochrome c oxidase subunit I [Aureisphaera galaxeae]|uniref:cbb3-type cytochrome c oxidase subunit I n=1 Tax=Aureisphaera galaxeae TaxID=1538023 RepID=UPI00234FC672|nr:cbb3-type cytochrome c oxidase subunit I [Aureisphaera galaxeae]MDC8004831.1 cbb3-type cytochrome c oxidase subunit I [Aureisphaera galaxeae]
MKTVVEKPYLIFLLSIPMVLLIGVLSGDTAFDINVHDTYFVIAYSHLTTLISFVFGVIGIGYWTMYKTNRALSQWLNGIHIGLTFGGAIIVWIMTLFYGDEIMEYELNNNLSFVITLVIAIMVLGQIIFPINIIYGLIKGKNIT